MAGETTDEISWEILVLSHDMLVKRVVKRVIDDTSKI